MSEFGARLKSLRFERGLSVKEVCKQVGIPPSRLVELESQVRIPTSGQIERLERFYEVESGALVALAQSSEKTRN